MMNNKEITDTTSRLRRIAKAIAPPRPIRFVLCVTAVSVMLFSIVRIALLLCNLGMLETGIDNDITWVMRSLWMGVRCDIDLVTKLMALPLLLLCIGHAIAPRLSKWFSVAAAIVAAILISMSLMLYIGDIPFFEYCNSHINAIAMSYLRTDTDQAFAMVINDYLGYATIVIVTTLLFIAFVTYAASHYHITVAEVTHRVCTAIYVVVMCGLLTFTARGLTFKPHPLEATDNAISSNNFINQLSANPIQPFIMTIFEGSERVIDFTDSKIALDYACRDLGRDATCREHIAAKPSPWRNIIIIAQEGNTAERLTREGHTKGLLPNLDRLIGEGRYYENAYASSTQTCYGLYSLVTSLPPYPNLHPLKDGVQRSLETVYEQVYSRGEMTTLFFITHHPDFDDMNVFIPMQGFERLISKQDYNFATNKTWGVDDHIMYDYALQEIDRQWSEGNDVAAVLLSCSNHRPFNAPTVEGFTPKSTDPEEEAIEYADWAMNRFLEMAKGREWFDHTLFVITSDHGRTVSEDYIINESIFHIPLLFYSPKHIEPEVRSDLVAQVDITPTAFSMLGKEFDNRTMGIDLTSHKRDYAVMTSAGIIACRSKRWLYAFNPETEEEYLYDLEAEIDSRLTNHAAEHRDIVEAMHKHATKTIQAGWDIHNTPTAIE